MGIKIKKRTLLTPKKIGLALVVVVFSSIIAYKQVIIPKKYSEYMELGKKNIVEGNYRQAIRNFEEVLIMDNDNIDAMLGLSKSYVGINDRKKVKEYVIKAQSLDMGNEDLVLQILDII
ncbi:tetratricopeptide repeat protein, partial [Intestinibacter sp.]|uniref:tetratricopeptide repeat protein n=1 Tax=Intestinibacter sp. TaxID=1965304 RepID=UPI002A90BB23